MERDVRWSGPQSDIILVYTVCKYEHAGPIINTQPRKRPENAGNQETQSR